MSAQGLPHCILGVQTLGASAFSICLENSVVSVQPISMRAKAQSSRSCWLLDLSDLKWKLMEVVGIEFEQVRINFGM